MLKRPEQTVVSDDATIWTHMSAWEGARACRALIKLLRVFSPFIRINFFYVLWRCLFPLESVHTAMSASL